MWSERCYWQAVLGGGGFLTIAAAVIMSPLEPKVIKNEHQTRNISFQHVGSLFAGRDFAHIFSVMNFSKLIIWHNLIIQNLDKTHLRVLNTTDVPTALVNSTFKALTTDLSDLRSELEYLCSALSCPVPPAKSELVDSTDDVLHTLPETLLSGISWSSVKFKGKRQKRQVAEILGLVSFGLSVFDLQQTLQLKSQLSQLENNNHLLASEIDQQGELIDDLSRHLGSIQKHLVEMNTWLNQEAWREGVRTLVALMRSAVTRLRRWIVGLNTIMIHRKIDPLILSSDQLSSALSILKPKALEKGYELLADQLFELSHEHLSYLSQEGEIFIILHIPMGRNPPLQMYKYLPVPLLLSDGQLALPQPGNFILAINDQCTEKLELENRELELCSRRGGAYICPKGLTSKRVTASCLGALFVGTLQQIRHECVFKRFKQDYEAISVIGPNKITLVSPPKTTTTVHLSCVDGNVSQTVVSGLVEIVIPAGCVLSTFNHVFKPDDSIKLEMFLARTIHSFDLNSSIFGTESPIPPAGFVEYPVRKWKSSAFVPPKQSDSYAVVFGLVIAITIICVLTVTALCYVGCRIWAESRRRRRPSAPTRRLKKMRKPTSEDTGMGKLSRPTLLTPDSSLGQQSDQEERPTVELDVHNDNF